MSFYTGMVGRLAERIRDHIHRMAAICRDLCETEVRQRGSANLNKRLWGDKSDVQIFHVFPLQCRWSMLDYLHGQGGFIGL